MKKRFGIIPFAVIAIVVTMASAAPAVELNLAQQKVLDYLVANWGRDMNVTGIDLAMKIVGGKWTDRDRYVLGVHIREHPELHRVIRQFRWETVALNPLEKRIGRLLSRAERGQLPAMTQRELARQLAATPEQVTGGLKMLERFGIIRRAEAAVVGYRLADERYVNWEGGMRITFVSHRVKVHGVSELDTF